MSEFKFACPVCGQHITCDAAAAGSQMNCPTCFRKIVVPRAPESGGGKLILTASEAGARPPTTIATSIGAVARPARSFPVAAVLLGLFLAGLATGAVVFREKLLRGRKTVSAPLPASSFAGDNAPPKLKPAPDPNWTLNLAGTKISDATVTGRINGQSFSLDRVTVQGGTLNFRQGPKWPPDLGATVALHARQAEDLAGQTVTIESTMLNPPKLILRWKDAQGQPVNRTIREGYALRVEFERPTNGRLPGRIFFAAPDDGYSWISGTFLAEIRKVPPPKTFKPSKPPGAGP